MDHLHSRPDPSPDWQTCPGLLPCIDRWGYLDPYASLHPASLSALIPAITDLGSPVVVRTNQPVSVLRLEPRAVSAEEEQAIFSNAQTRSTHGSKHPLMELAEPDRAQMTLRAGLVPSLASDVKGVANLGDVYS